MILPESRHGKTFAMEALHERLYPAYDTILSHGQIERRLFTTAARTSKAQKMRMIFDIARSGQREVELCTGGMHSQGLGGAGCRMPRHYNADATHDEGGDLMNRSFHVPDHDNSSACRPSIGIRTISPIGVGNRRAR